MKRILFTIIASITLLTSCEKEDNGKGFITVVSKETAQLRLSNADFEMDKIIPLGLEDDYDFYTSGVVEYKKDGVLLATIDYGTGEKDDVAIVLKDGESENVDLGKNESGFVKVIKEAIVKTDDCDYIVSGIIKYYEKGVWTATVDFGDGTCDDLAIKYTDDGEVYVFKISDWY